MAEPETEIYHGFEWGDPPPKRTPSGSSSAAWAKVLQALRSRPGEWLRVINKDGSTLKATTAINKCGIPGCYPWETFEAIVRSKELYVRAKET